MACIIVSTGTGFTINGLHYDIDQGSVIILSAEDHISYTIIPRLIAINPDRSNIEIINTAVEVSSQENERFIYLDRDIGLLEDKIKTLGNVKLIIIDPITAYLGNVKENKSCEVRAFLLRLNKLAEKYKLAIVLNTHTRKHSGGEMAGPASDEIMGSSAWAIRLERPFRLKAPR